MTRSIRFLLFSLLPCFITPLLPSLAFAQVATGTPPLGSFAGGPDIINLGNNNAHFAIGVLQKPGRGASFTYELSYDSSVWYPVTSGSTTTWTPVYNWGWRGQTEAATGYISYLAVTLPCIIPFQPPSYYTLYDAWIYHDPFGVGHIFYASVSTGGDPRCSPPPYTATATANDGSGYTISVTASPSATVYSSTGTIIAAPLLLPNGAGNFTDRNGNQLTADSSGHFYDTLSSTSPVLTVSGSGTPSSPTVFTYTPPSTSSSSCAATNTNGVACYAVSYVNYTVGTNFAVSGITEYGAHAISLVDRVTLPDGSFYQFTYEPTPSTPSNHACTPLSGTYQTNCVTARVTKITLPTGGYIAYSYSAGAGTNSSGIFADGSAATLQRTLNNGTDLPPGSAHGIIRHSKLVT